MANRPPFAFEEWYHCYTRGVDKRKTFQTQHDFQRFIQILYLANSVDTIQRSNFLGAKHAELLQKKRGKPLVAIGAYCLMPNHFHILMQEINEGGIARFMQKVGIAYSMYFNIKNERIGNLFVKPFRSRHIDDDAYLRKVAQYIHLNPLELHDPRWESVTPKQIAASTKRLQEYPYSSLPDYVNGDRPERVILDPEAYELIADSMPSFVSLVEEAYVYHRDLGLGNVKITS